MGCRFWAVGVVGLSKTEFQPQIRRTRGELETYMSIKAPLRDPLKEP